MGIKKRGIIVSNTRRSLRTPLHEAALQGHEQKVKDILCNLCNFAMLNLIDEAECTPLDRAAARGHAGIVKCLVAAHKASGHDYQMQNKNCYTPLLSAVRWFYKVLDG